LTQFDGSHQGVLCHENYAKCLDTERTKSFYFYLTDPETQVERPKGKVAFAREVSFVSTRHAGRKQEDVEVEEEPEPEEQEPEEPEPKRLKFPEELHREISWDSPEYKRYFNPSDIESVRECLQRRIDDLAHVNRGERHWIDIIDNHDQDNICTSKHIFYIRNKCLLLAMSYKNALEFMGDFTKSWEQCCDKAIRDCSDVGFNGIRSGRTITTWNQWFRKHENFPCPTTKKLQEPLRLQLFPATKPVLLDWIYINMADLTCNNLRQYLVDTVLPDLNDGQYLLSEEQQYILSTEQQKILSMLIESPPSETTIWRWLKLLGFVHDVRKKTFYVDGHEQVSLT
jgi:hypothetical protein